jgi:hypothetical protein
VHPTIHLRDRPPTAAVRQIATGLRHAVAVTSQRTLGDRLLPMVGVRDFADIEFVVRGQSVFAHRYF